MQLIYGANHRMSVKQAILDFTDGEIRNRIFVTPDIPVKKLNAARSQFILRDEEVIVLYDDTVFGSGKDGIAITENYIYAKQLWEVPKSIKISSIRSITSQSKTLNNLEIYLNNNHFVTVSSSDKADHEFLIGVLKAAKDAAAKPRKGAEKAASVEETRPPVSVRSAPRAKPRSAATEETLSCDECSVMLPNGAKFCLECGTKVLPKGVCLECNAKLPEKARFCPECGAPAGKASSKPAEPEVDTEALRAELTSWLSSAEQDASIDNDGDLTVSLNATAPPFAKDFRSWVAQYDLSIGSEGVNEEANDSSFFGRSDEFFVRSPYCRVGKLASASYEMAIKLQVYTLQELEIHEVELKDGALSIPKLGSSKVKIKSLAARRDDDGSYGIEYELEAYSNHVAYFEFLTEKPDEDAGVWARVQEDNTQSGTSWLWDVEPGQKVYVCFGEYKPLVDGIEASFSGRTKLPASENDRGLSLALNAFGTTHDPLIYDPEDGKFPALNYWRDDDLESFIDNIVDNSSIGKNRGSDFYKAGYEEEFGNGWVKLRVTLSRILSEDEHEKFKIHSEYPNGQLVVFEVIFDSGDYDPEKPSYLLYVHIISDEDSGEYWGFWYQTNCDSCDPRDSECFEEMMGDVQPLEGERSDSDVSNSASKKRLPNPHDNYEENMVKNDLINEKNQLAKLASKLEEKFISNGKIAAFFEDCDNLYIQIYLDLDPTGNTLLYEVIIETDGNCEDEIDTQEEILDYISDNGLSDGLEEIFGDRDVTDDTVWNVHIRPLQNPGSSKLENQNDVDWHQAADRAFNFFFNAIRKGEDIDTAAEWFRGEVAEQTEAAGISYDYGWEQAITVAHLQIISDTVANRLKGLNEEQGYEVSSDFYQGFITSFSNIIYNRSQEGGGDFGALQTYWDQTISNELPEECGTKLAEPTASAPNLTNPQIGTKFIGEHKVPMNSNYSKCVFLNIATIEDPDFPSPVGVGKNPIIILASDDEEKFVGLIGEDISKSHEIMGDSFADVIGGYAEYIQNEFSKLHQSDIEESFLFEFILGLYSQDFDDFEYENEDAHFSYYDFSDDINFEESLGKYGFLLASMYGDCVYKDKSLNIIGDNCASAGDCLEVCMSNGNQYAAFLD